MEILCFPCQEGSGVSAPATNLVPQDYTEQESERVKHPLHWIAVCDGHLSGWYDDCDEEFCKLKPIPVAQAQ